MRKQSGFLDTFLRGSGPSLELLGAFALGLIVVGILSNLAYDFVIQPLVGLWPFLRALMAIVILMFGAYGLYLRDLRYARVLRANVDESRLVRPCAGIVWMLGPGNFDHLLVALRHHQQHGGAAHCWLVMEEHNEPVANAYTGVLQKSTEIGLTTRFHPHYIQNLDTRAGYAAVSIILERETIEESLAPEQVVCDITGGTKPLTAGMLLASLANGSDLEYVETDRDEQGRPIPETARVIAVDVSFYLEQSDPRSSNETV